MTVYDYYEPERYSLITYDCSREIIMRKNVNNPLDAFIALLELTEDDEDFREEFPIDKKGCLFYLLCKYATSKDSRQRIISMSQVIDFKTKRGKNSIHTVLGDAEFELYLKNMFDILVKYLDTDVSKIKTLWDLYQGKLYQYCHYSVAELGKNYDVVSAFVPGKFDRHRFVHSYLERDGMIYDVSNNLVMSKDDYYSLLSPEEVLKMSGEELYRLIEDNPEEKAEDVYLDRVDKVLEKKR